MYESLAAHFGEDQVFIDVDTIRPGSDFTEALDAALDECDVLLALIGRTWLTRTDQNTHRRLDDPHDFVRRELEAALRRRIVIISLLVQGIDIPAREQLPDSLGNIATRHALELSDRRERCHRSVRGESVGERGLAGRWLRRPRAVAITPRLGPWPIGSP